MINAIRHLRPQERKLVAEYLVDFSESKAAVRAGYPQSHLKDLVKRLFEREDIKAAIDQASYEQMARTFVTADGILAHMAELAEVKLTDVASWDEYGTLTFKPSDQLTDAQASAIQEMSKTVTQHGGSQRIKLVSKVDLLTKLATHLGMFLERRLGTQLPPINTPSDAVKAMEALMNAMGSGELDVNTGKILTDILEVYRKLVDNEEFAAKLVEFETLVRSQLDGGGEASCHRP